MSISNSARLIGNVGDDPKIKSLEDKSKLATFSMATNEHYRDSEGKKQTSTTWHNVVAWGKTAEIVENYVLKGKKVAVDGRMNTRKYEDKDGVNRTVTEVVVEEISLLSPKEQLVTD